MTSSLILHCHKCHLKVPNIGISTQHPFRLVWIGITGAKCKDKRNVSFTLLIYKMEGKGKEKKMGTLVTNSLLENTLFHPFNLGGFGDV